MKQLAVFVLLFIFLTPSLHAGPGCADNPIATDNTPLPICYLDAVYEYNGSNQLISITVEYPNISTNTLTEYVFSLTYTGSNIATTSRWVAQA